MRYHMPILVTLAMAFCSLSSIPAHAQSLQDEVLEDEGLSRQPAKGDWDITLGAGVAGVPVYQGASRYRARPVPFVRLSYRDLVFLSPLGLGVNVVNTKDLRLGVLLGYEGGRNEDADPHLTGLGDIPASATAGIFAAYRLGHFEFTGRAQQAITHSGNGLNGLLAVNYHAALIPHRLDVSFGPNLEFGDAHYDNTHFGVTADQSTLSGLPLYTPGAAVRSVGLHMVATYHFSEHLSLRSFANVKELTGSVANSPIVETKTQMLFGTGLAYHF